MNPEKRIQNIHTINVNAKQEKNIKFLVTGFNKTRDLRAGDVRTDSSNKNQ